MSSKNIFEVLQNIAENTESNEKFLNILKENGFTGTLEEAENQINQQAQVVLNNLTTEDLQNIAGGKSLMNDKLKKAIAVGGASLMAAGTVMPSSLAANKNDTKKFADSALTYVKKHPIHTGVTSTFVLTTAALLAPTIFGGKTVETHVTTNIEPITYLRKINLTDANEAIRFVVQLDEESSKFNVVKTKSEITIQITAMKNNVMQTELYGTEGAEKQLNIKDLTLTLLQKLDSEGHEYVGTDGTLTVKGVEPAMRLCEYIVDGLYKNAKAANDKATTDVENAQNTLNGAQSENQATAQAALKEAQATQNKTKEKLEILSELKATKVSFKEGYKKAS